MLGRIYIRYDKVKEANKKNDQKEDYKKQIQSDVTVKVMYIRKGFRNEKLHLLDKYTY